MAEEQKINLDEAKQIVSDWGNPNVKSEEFEKLKEASLLLLKEHDANFDLNYEVEEGAPRPKTKSGTLDHIKSQFSTLGIAGTMALASAAYFQTDTIVEQTRYVAEVAEEKWEEFIFEHPNVGWHDPLASFTTIIGGVEPEGGIKENPNPRPTKPLANDQEEKQDESDQPKESSEGAPEKAIEKEEAPKEKPKKKGLLSKIFGSKEKPKQEQPTEGTDEPGTSGQKSEEKEAISNDQNEKQQAELQTDAKQDKPAEGRGIDSLSLNQPQLSEEVMEVVEMVNDTNDQFLQVPKVVVPDEAIIVSPSAGRRTL